MTTQAAQRRHEIAAVASWLTVGLSNASRNSWGVETLITPNPEVPRRNAVLTRFGSIRGTYERNPAGAAVMLRKGASERRGKVTPSLTMPAEASGRLGRPSTCMPGPRFRTPQSLGLI